MLCLPIAEKGLQVGQDCNLLITMASWDACLKNGCHIGFRSMAVCMISMSLGIFMLGKVCGIFRMGKGCDADT